MAAIRIARQTEVVPGDIVGALYDRAELAHMQRLEHEYEDMLVRLLRNPEDPTAGNGLAALRGASEQARADPEEPQLIVPVGDVLTDVQVRLGPLVNPRQTVATRAGFEILARCRGTCEISPEVIGAEEAYALMGRLLPTGTEDGALALVYADLSEVLVSSTGSEHPLYDGMRESVRVPVREERFVVTLWPALARGERRMAAVSAVGSGNPRRRISSLRNTVW